ncbi:MAG: AAA family ATPase [bacterium]|nr:AAA family ATPase [bacterium]
MSNKLICLVGMAGAGKSEVANYLMSKKEFGFFRFGQITLDTIKKLGQKPTEALEREIREGLRKKHGMAAFAILNMPKIDELLVKSDVIGDGLYSWEEYLVLQEKYPNNFITIAVYTPPGLRYARLESRSNRHGEDKDLRFRSFTKEETIARDKAEIENLHKAGPIAMADHTIINQAGLNDLKKQTDSILEHIFG